MTDPSASALVDKLSSHPELALVAAHVRHAALQAADARSTRPRVVALEGATAATGSEAADAGATGGEVDAEAREGAVEASANGEDDASGSAEASDDEANGDAAASGSAEANGSAEASGSGEADGDDAGRSAMQDDATAAVDRKLADTDFGNAYDALEAEVPSPQQAALVSALLAMSLAGELPSAPEDELELAVKLVWLATHTPFNALVAADEALGDKAGALWQAVGTIAGQPAKVASDFGRCEALVAAAALGASQSGAAGAAREHALKKARDPLIVSTLTDHRQRVDTLAGELAPRPHGPLMTALLAVTLILAVMRLGNLVARLALAYRRPAKLFISSRGLELEWRTELLGKVLRDRSQLIPLSNLARVTREVRYPRLGLYAGLFAMALGTYFGMGLFVDAVRVPGGSLALFSMALVLMALGLLIDFGLSSLADSARGKCRVVVVPRKGRALAVGALDPRQADAMLSALAESGAETR